MMNVSSLPPAVAPGVGPSPTFVLQPSTVVPVMPAQWQAYVAKAQSELSADGIDPWSLVPALAGFALADVAGRSWSFDGRLWFIWDGQGWRTASPPDALRLASVTFDLVGEAHTLPPLPALAALVDGPTHLVPPTGTPAWATPVAAAAPIAVVPPQLAVAVLEWQPTGWAQIQTENGWRGWVDGRQLQPLR